MNLLQKTWYREGFSILKEGLIRNNDGTFCEIKGRILLTNDSWKRRTIKLWNKMTTTLRMEDNAATFKVGLKDWIQRNVNVRIQWIPPAQGGIELFPAGISLRSGRY